MVVRLEHGILESSWNLSQNKASGSQGTFFDSRIPFTWIMTENRLLATSLSKKEIITKATFVFLQPQLSTQLDKELV